MCHSALETIRGKLLSSFAFNFNSRRYIKVLRTASSTKSSELSSGRTSTSQSEVMSQSQLLSQQSEAATATGFRQRRGGVVQLET
jgi:hypothetical protein